MVGGVGGMRAKPSKTLSLVFNRFLRGPVRIKGFIGGEQGGRSLFGAQTIYFLLIEARKYFVLQVFPLGPTASRGIEARNAGSILEYLGD